MQPQRRGNLFRMRTRLHLLDRPQAQHLQGSVIQSPAVVLPHAEILPESPLKSTYL